MLGAGEGNARRHGCGLYVCLSRNGGCCILLGRTGHSGFIMGGDGSLFQARLPAWVAPPGSEPHKVFTTHTFTYGPGDLVYLYSDGYLDQFGEETGRRLGHRRFRELIMDYAFLPMAQQKELLESFLRQVSG